MIRPSVLVNGVEADPSKVVMPITIKHGRSSPDKQPDAPTATLIWKSPVWAPVLGDTIEVRANIVGIEAPLWDDPLVHYDDSRVTYDGLWIAWISRFVGTVTDAEAQEWKGLPGHVRVTAVSKQADLGRTGVLLDQPVESDVARVQAIAADAGVAIEIVGNPGPNLAPDTVDKDALGALHEVTNSSGGLVWTKQDGSLVYGTADHRGIGEPVAALPAHAIISGLKWQTSVDDLVNRVTMTYGPENAQTQKTIQDDLSVNTYGQRYRKVSTMLNTEEDALYTAAVILGRRAWPYWGMSDILMDSEHVNNDVDAMTTALLLKVSDAIYLPIPPDPGPAGEMAEWIVEGWSEEWPESDHLTLQFAVSDRVRFALTTLRLWIDAQPQTWQEELDRGAWLNALIKKGTEA